MSGQAAAGPADFRLGPGERAVFTSDVHLQQGGADELAEFTEFLAQVRAAAPKALFIHGDLFEFYVGPRQGRTAFFKPLLAAIADLVQAGIEVWVQRGNRDFMIGAAFRKVGARVAPDQILIDAGGRLARLSHGDELCIHDHSYLFWARGVLRAAPIRLFLRCLPLAFGFWLARRYRRVSAAKMKRYATRSRLGTILDGAHEALAAGPAEIVIAGHVHHMAETPIESGGRKGVLWTTGSWQDDPNYLVWDGTGFGLRTWAPGEPVVLERG